MKNQKNKKVYDYDSDDKYEKIDWYPAISESKLHKYGKTLIDAVNYIVYILLYEPAEPFASNLIGKTPAGTAGGWIKPLRAVCILTNPEHQKLRKLVKNSIKNLNREDTKKLYDKMMEKAAKGLRLECITPDFHKSIIKNIDDIFELSVEEINRNGEPGVSHQISETDNNQLSESDDLLDILIESLLKDVRNWQVLFQELGSEFMFNVNNNGGKERKDYIESKRPEIRISIKKMLHNNVVLLCK